MRVSHHVKVEGVTSMGPKMASVEFEHYDFVMQHVMLLSAES